MSSGEGAAALPPFAGKAPDEPAPLTERRDVNRSYADGATYSLMVGFGETYLPAFALAIGMGQVASGLLSTIPLLAGGFFQLLAPRGALRFGSYRAWVVACASAQALSFILLAVAAASGSISALALFGIATLYWGFGMAAGPVWNSWIDAIIPKRRLTDFLAKRTRLTQLAAFLAFLAGGALLSAGSEQGRVLPAFVLLFGLAAVSRLASAACLGQQTDAPPPTSAPKVSFSELASRFLAPTSSRFLLFLLVQQVSTNVASPYFSPFMLAHLRFSYAEYAALVSASYLSKILLYPYIARAVKTLGPYRALWVSGIFVAPLPLFWLILSDLAAICAVQVVAGFFWGCFELASMLLMFDRIEQKERILILTAYNLMNAIAVVVGSLIGGAFLSQLGDGFGYTTVFAASALARLLSLVVLARAKHLQSITVKFRQYYTRTIGLRPGRGAILQPILTDDRDESDET